MRNKKWILGIVLIAVATALAYAQSPASDFKYVIVENEEVHIIEYIGRSTVVSIPPQIRNLPVTLIGAESFSNKNLTRVIIPDSVIVIDSLAFAYNRIPEVTIPSSVRIIGVGAFYQSRVRSVTILGPCEIWTMAFAGNEHGSLTSLNIADNSVIAGGAFGELLDLMNLTQITLGSNIYLATPFVDTELDVRFNNVFLLGLDDLYITLGRRAGTYTYRNGRWNESFR